MTPESDVLLAGYTTLGVGGPAAHFAQATTEGELVAALQWASSRGVALRVLGGGSNVVVSDAGFDGLVLKVGMRGVSTHDAGSHAVLTAGAGEPWDALVERAASKDLCGIECLSGIPGLAGATPIQNVGAYGQEVAQTIASVRVLDRRTLEVEELSPRQCGFAYRDSYFKSREPERFIVLAVSYRLRRGRPDPVTYPDLQSELARRGASQPRASELREAVVAVRRAKSMLIDPDDPNARSCGSFFVNPVVSAAQLDELRRAAGDELPHWPQPDGRVKLPAAWLIERAGLSKGTREGAVGLSTKHTLALVCHQGARASDVVGFARKVQNAVAERFAVQLVPEPVFWGFQSLDAGLPDERLT